MDIDVIEIARIEREITGLPKMTIAEAVAICENRWDDAGYEPEEYHRLNAWQRLIDTGVVWQLQGCFGRQAVALIEAGECTR